MGLFDRGVQMLLTTVGAFAAFSLMTIAVGTDYWLYSRGVCKVKSNNENETSKKNEEVMTHSGLWRTCCLEALFHMLALRPQSRGFTGISVFTDAIRPYATTTMLRIIFGHALDREPLVKGSHTSGTELYIIVRNGRPVLSLALMLPTPTLHHASSREPASTVITGSPVAPPTSRQP
ncbi:hypothetical protein AAFF_G00296360 [Aldrovandia affinis]|uniref:Uncharacterized protein n=1 Tax=Aldrovandia affinis TaxID=143900 RepID=A0AAD7SQF5_9TELE|nr:hypothetical protein AAFF_G00296360 [Aldrovandia affinis]